MTGNPAPLPQAAEAESLKPQTAENKAGVSAEKPKPVASSKPIPQAKNPSSPSRTTGTVRFNVGPGVQVFWDGREVDPNQPLPNQTVGKHRIMLLSPGFDPIRGEVMVKEGEPTMVNAQ